MLNGWNRPVFIHAAHKKKAKACNSAGLNNKAKWSKQNAAKCFCKVRNHAQCFTLNTSGKYHCCFRIKHLNAILHPNFFMSRSRHDHFPRLSRYETETLKNVSRDRDTSRDIQLCRTATCRVSVNAPLVNVTLPSFLRFLKARLPIRDQNYNVSKDGNLNRDLPTQF